ncbi:MAG: RluA family pseudouridine synthase [Candidatus Omnitrophota bacterium]
MIETECVGVRVDVFLKDKEPDLSRTQIKELVLEGKVTVNGQKVKPHYRLKTGDVLNWQIPAVAQSSIQGENIPLTIVFEDKDIIVLNKPSGLVVHPGAGNREHTLVNALLFHTQELSSLSEERPGIVHRLDKETSGIMVIAKNNHSHLELAKQFKIHSIERRYIALVSGGIEFDEGVIDIPIKRHVMDRKKMSVSFTDEAKPAQTRYRVLKRYPEYSAVELFPQTGRTHQLRVHLNYLGHPVLGDSVYGKKTSFPRLALHAKDLGFNHPSSGEFVKFSSPLPEEMKAAMPGLKI